MSDTKNKEVGIEAGQDTIETSREALTEQLYARLDSTDARVTVERTTHYHWIDARPQLTDEVVAQPEMETALEATGKVRNGDYVGAAHEVREQIGNSRLDAEKFEKDADVFAEFLRKFVGRVRDKMLSVTGGLDTSFIENGASIGQAIDNNCAFLVAPGTQKEIQELFTTIYESHFNGVDGDVNYGKKSLETPAPSDMLSNDVGFTIPIQQEGRETSYLYFLYGKVESNEEEGPGTNENNSATISDHDNFEEDKELLVA